MRTLKSEFAPGAAYLVGPAARSLGLAAVLVLFWTGCSREVPAPESPQKVIVEVRRDRFELVLPEGWEHASEDGVHVFRNASSRLTLSDRGPFSSEAFLAEFEDALVLFRSGDLMGAGETLRALNGGSRNGQQTGPGVRKFFPASGSQRWETFWPAWRLLKALGQHHDPQPEEAIEDAFALVVETFEDMEPIELAKDVPAALDVISQVGQREVSHREERSVAGSRALLLHTWDRLSHRQRRQHLLFLSEGRLIVLETQFGDETEMTDAFAEILESFGGAPAVS